MTYLPICCNKLALPAVRAHALMKMVLSTLGGGVGISAQDGDSTHSAIRTGTKVNGRLTPCKDKANSHSRTDRTTSAAGKQDSHIKEDGALLMGRLSMKGSSRGCCGMALVHCIRLASENTWVRSSGKAIQCFCARYHREGMSGETIQTR